MESRALGDQSNLLGSKVQGRLLVLGLACEADLPREAQHVLHRVVDAQSASVVEWGAALIILTAQQRFYAAMLQSDTVDTLHSLNI